jgi:CRP/FNR family transcriptional regulator, polysaccharide utilization system transcription regulator
MEEKESFAQWLSGSYLFSSLDDGDRYFLENNSVEVRYNRGENIYKQGTFCTHAYYLLGGYALVYIEKGNAQRILKIIKPGWFVGLLGIFGYEHYYFSARALQPCSVRLIKTENLKELILRNSDFAFRFIKELSLLSSDLSRFYVLNNLKSVRGRIAEILLHLSRNIYKNSRFDLTFTRKEIAELSNSSTESAIRTLSDFRKEGLIIIEDHQIGIINDAALEKISETG